MVAAGTRLAVVRNLCEYSSICTPTSGGQIAVSTWLLATLLSVAAHGPQHHADAPSNDAGPAIARWLLPPDLDEISGLVLTSDARLLAHADHRGEVAEIDYRHGVVVKRFALGKPTVRGDVEAITLYRWPLAPIRRTAP